MSEKEDITVEMLLRRADIMDNNHANNSSAIASAIIFLARVMIHILWEMKKAKKTVIVTNNYEPYSEDARAKNW